MFAKLEMYIPNMPHKPRQDLPSSLLAKFGGCTLTQGLGYWNPDNAGLHDTQVESVSIITCYFEDSEDNRLWIEDLARKYKDAADQSTVLYAINGHASFIND